MVRDLDPCQVRFRSGQICDGSKGQIPEFPGFPPKIPGFPQIFVENPGFSQNIPKLSQKFGKILKSRTSCFQVRSGQVQVTESGRDLIGVTDSGSVQVE